MKGMNIKMGYKKETVEKKVAHRSNRLYQEGCVNYRGKTTDTKELYTEVISRLLLSDISLLKKDIKPITRVSSYKVKSHKWHPYEPTAERKEEVFARSLFGTKLGELEILDYQVPLKDKRNEANKGLGKIDLLAWDGNSFVILELKKPKSPETLLRCVLEAYTYLNIVDQKKLAENFCKPGAPVRASVLVFEGENSRPYTDWKCKNQPQVKALMKALNVGLYTLKSTDDKKVRREV